LTGRNLKIFQICQIDFLIAQYS